MTNNSTLKISPLWPSTPGRSQPVHSATFPTNTNPPTSTFIQRQIPMPPPMKALRLPANGSPFHLRPKPQNSTSATTAPCSNTSLLNNIPFRHVSNVRLFWAPKAWDLRDVVKFRYVNTSMPNLNGRYYCLFMTDATKGLRVNRWLSDEKFDYWRSVCVQGGWLHMAI